MKPMVSKMAAFTLVCGLLLSACGGEAARGKRPRAREAALRQVTKNDDYVAEHFAHSVAADRYGAEQD